VAHAHDDRGSLAYVYLLTSVAALGGLLFGYDTAVIAGAIKFLKLRFTLDEFGEGWAVASILVGCMVGAALAGILSDRLGRKRVLLLSAVLFGLSSVGAALAPDIQMFVVARLLGGLGVGMASIVSPLYIAEVAPANIRGLLVSLNQVAIISGMVIVSLANWGIADYGSKVDGRTAATCRTQSHCVECTHGEASGRSETASYECKECAPATVQSFITKHGPKIEPADVSAFLAEHKNAPDNAAVVAFLKKQKIEVEESAVELARIGLLPWNEEYGWAVMFGVGALPALLFFLAVFAVPESPRWLTKQGRGDEALVVLSRVGGSQLAQRQMREIEEAIAEEEGTIRDLFRPGVRVALGIAIVLAILQQVTGINAVVYYAPKIFESAETTPAQALLQTVALQLMNLFCTLISILVVDRVGRKPLLLVASAAMGISLLLLGGAFYFELSAAWIFGFTLAYIGSFAAAMGPVVWVLLSEIFPTRTRGRAMSIAIVALWIACYAVAQSVPWMFAHAGHTLTFGVYALMCAVAFVFVALFVPETKGKTLEEIERSWIRGKAEG
jgi:MFS family permease